MSASMFPARAGMSRGAGAVGEGVWDVPRASGDEPLISATTRKPKPCSPRERG